MSTKNFSARLSETNLNHLKEINEYFEANSLLSSNSTNAQINFMINEFYQLFVSSDLKNFLSQEIIYFDSKTNISDKKTLSEIKNKINFNDNNIQIILYILLVMNRSINPSKPDENGLMKSIITPGNDFNQWVQMAQNSIDRDRKKSHVRKYKDE